MIVEPGGVEPPEPFRLLKVRRLSQETGPNQKHYNPIIKTHKTCGAAALAACCRSLAVPAPDFQLKQ